MRSRPLLGLGLLAAGTLLSMACDRAAPPAPSPEASRPLEPWRWHVVGGLLVVEGEVDRPTAVTLRGGSLRAACELPAGPVRWELYRPPRGEVADLRDGDGRLLAHWDFDAPPPEPPKPPPALPPAPLPAAAPVPPPQPVPAPIAGPGSVPLPRAASVAAPRSAQSAQAPKAAPVAALRPVPPPKVAPIAALRLVPAAKAAPVAALRPIPPPKAASAAAPRPVPAAKAAPLAAPRSVLAPPSVPAGPSRVLPVGGAGGNLWPGAGEGLNLLRGPQGGHRICLTFDGGSTAEVAAEVLDLLRQRGIRTTFFLTGTFIRKYPDMVRRMDREGHEIGNHSLTHPHFAPGMKRDPRWTKERFHQELVEADRSLYQLLGRPMDCLWRAPYGEQNLELRRWAEEIGYRHVGWSEGADTLDWATAKDRRLYRSGAEILDRLHKRMERQDGDGLIVLMHLGSARPEEDRPAKVLGPFLDRAQRQGWHFVSIGDYLRSTAEPPWEAARRIALLTSPGRIRGAL